MADREERQPWEDLESGVLTLTLPVPCASGVLEGWGPDVALSLEAPLPGGVDIVLIVVVVTVVMLVESGALRLTVVALPLRFSNLGSVVVNRLLVSGGQLDKWRGHTGHLNKWRPAGHMAGPHRTYSGDTGQGHLNMSAATCT